MGLTIFGDIFVAVLLVSLVMTFLFLKKCNVKFGCATVMFMGSIIMIVNMFTALSWGFTYQAINDVYNAYERGEAYSAEVISYQFENVEYDSETGESTPMYRATVKFTVDNEIIEAPLDFTSSDFTIGENYTISYDKQTQNVITLGPLIIARVVMCLVFCSIFTFFFVGVMRKILGMDMTPYFNLAVSLGLNVVVPFLVFCLNAALIYAVLTRDDFPVWLSVILWFFIISLSLFFFTYMKGVFAQEKECDDVKKDTRGSDRHRTESVQENERIATSSKGKILRKRRSGGPIQKG